MLRPTLPLSGFSVSTLMGPPTAYMPVGGLAGRLVSPTMTPVPSGRLLVLTSRLTGLSAERSCHPAGGGGAVLWPAARHAARAADRGLRPTGAGAGLSLSICRAAAPLGPAAWNCAAS